MPRNLERRREWNRERYHKTMAAQLKEQYLKNKEAGICTSCMARPAREGRIICEVCFVGMQKRNVNYQNRVRRAAFNAYGGAICACCGEIEEMFLSLDHIHDDGSKHRKAIEKEYGSNNIYVWLKKNNYPPGFQVLCQNCNIGRFRNGGICPHQTQPEPSLDQP